jgi:hypothetical protein
MYRVASEQVDLLVTPQHRMWIRRHDTQAAKRGEQPYAVELAHEIFGKRVHYQKTARWTGQEEGVVELPTTSRQWVRSDTGTTTVREYTGVKLPLRAFARFLGWWLAEGSLNGHQIIVAQEDEQQIAEIAETIRDLGLKPYLPVGGHCVRTQCTSLRDFLATLGRAAHL